MLSIYLAGGTHSDWQSIFWKEFGDDFVIYDPSRHGLHNPKEFTHWDLLHLKKSDIVMAVMEASNPSGYGLALEIGYARALGKSIFLVDSRSCNDAVFRKYFNMARECVDIDFNSIEEAVVFLRTFTSK